MSLLYTPHTAYGLQSTTRTSSLGQTMEVAKAKWLPFHQISPIISQICHHTSGVMGTEVASAHCPHVFENPLLAVWASIFHCNNFSVNISINKSFGFMTRTITPHYKPILCIDLFWEQVYLWFVAVYIRSEKAVSVTLSLFLLSPMAAFSFSAIPLCKMSPPQLKCLNYYHPDNSVFVHLFWSVL